MKCPNNISPDQDHRYDNGHEATPFHETEAGTYTIRLAVASTLAETRTRLWLEPKNQQAWVPAYMEQLANNYQHVMANTQYPCAAQEGFEDSFTSRNLKVPDFIVQGRNTIEIADISEIEAPTLQSQPATTPAKAR